MAVLKERLEKLDTASVLEQKLAQAESDKQNSARQLELATRVRENIKLKKAVEIFSEFVESILTISAFFYPKTNEAGNLEFKIGLEDQTTVYDGFSFTRVLSAIFDLTLLTLHSAGDFYKFCYHDGLLESLDDRVKIKLIDVWRITAELHQFQLIITVLDSDLPLTAQGKKKYFKEEEIIRELHDRGDSGRLFKMKPF